jgi:HEAT repeat protein
MLKQILQAYIERPLLLSIILFCLGLIFGCLILVCLSLLTHFNKSHKTKLREQFANQIKPLIIAVLFQGHPLQEVWKQVPRQQEDYFLDLLYQHHQRLKGDVSERIGLLATPYLQGLKAQFKHRETFLRARALKLASTFEEQKYLAPLLQGLKDPSPEVILVCFQVLSQPHIQGYNQEILASLERLENISAAYLSALLARKGTSISAGLRQILANSAQPLNLRVIAAKTLLNLNDFESVKIALAILKQEDQVDILIPALMLLEKLSSSNLSQEILPFCNAPQFAVRAYALKALASSSKEAYTELFLEKLADPSPWVARQAAFALKKTGQIKLLERLSRENTQLSEIAKQTLEIN